jgi:glucose/arabinose dehydrogenase
MLKIKILIALIFALGGLCFLTTDHAGNTSAHAFSVGPPAGYTRAPGELDCSECHLVAAAGSGQLSIDAPQTYTPGQTYDITVRHPPADPPRLRGGFQLPALAAADERAGTLEQLDVTTQTVEGQGPFPARQYIEHTFNGTFTGQTDGASWTFRWKAPLTDVGPVTFYAAGNQANNDRNTSGDHIYFTFASVPFSPPPPDFTIVVAPSLRVIERGASTTYDVTVNPLGGFTGSVTLSAAGLPFGATASFDPPAVNLDDASPKTATLTVSTNAGTHTGNFLFKVNGAGGPLTREAEATLRVFAPTDSDLSVRHTVSPNPAQVGAESRLTVTTTNEGPAGAVNPEVLITLSFSPGPIDINFPDNCKDGPIPFGVALTCDLPSLAPGQSAPVEILVRPKAAGSITFGASADADGDDPNPSNNGFNTTFAVFAEGAAPSMTVPNLGVREVVGGLNQPTGIAFLGADDFLVLEKESGRVRRVRNKRLEGDAVLDLSVNSASERGLLGIALHPDFASNKFAYLFWTESSTGADTTDISAVPLLGNRVDRYVWDGSRLTHDRNLLRLRALQTDAGQPARSNHNGGRLRFGPDGKLYVLAGDLGRRGFLQNINTVGSNSDDEFGGPAPDDAHLSGVILRLDDDGSTPSDNPFFNADAGLTGEAAANVKKLFAYGVRNSFGMDFDPVGGALWTQENGDDSFDELNRVTAGFNGGWIQLMGPSSRVAQFKAIEQTQFNQSLQQERWPPSNIADTPAEALARLYALPGSHYAEPEFSWKYAVAPSPLGFARGAGLGPEYANDLFVGASRTTLLGGYLMQLDLSADRQSIHTTDARLADKVADNSDKFDLTESESLVVGRNFGITTDIQTAPGGNLYVVSLSRGAVYEVFARRTLFVAELLGINETPPNDSPARGLATLVLSEDETTALVSLRFRGLTSPQTDAHIHGPAAFGQPAPPVFDLPDGGFTNFRISLTPQQVADLKSFRFYLNVHSENFPAGEIRGQFGRLAAATSVLWVGSGDVEVGEGAGSAALNFERLGITSDLAALQYTTADGTAEARTDYTAADGTLRFAPGETAARLDLLITSDAYTEEREHFDLIFTEVAGGLVFPSDRVVRFHIEDDDATPPPVNPSDVTETFVRQHYHDFLGREPDEAGLRFWMGQIDICPDAPCREVRRVNVSAAFFLSIEFQETGYLVYRFYKAAYGDFSPQFVPFPIRLSEFIPDTSEVRRDVQVGVGDWVERLEANKAAFADAFVARRRFLDFYPETMTPAAFVDKLNANAGGALSQSERDQLVADLTSGAKTRAQVLRAVAEDQTLRDSEFRKAFVLMQYFGYLRRDPDLDGFNFWLRKLNEHNGNFVTAEMVRAFLSSIEYRQRFGPQ